METQVNRRSFVRVGSLTGVSVLAAACTPAATPVPAAQPAPSAAPAAARAEWEAAGEGLAADARKEGKLVVHSLPGTGYRKLMDAFEAAFPGIAVEHSGVFASTWAPKVLQERGAGVYAWDVSLAPTITGFSALYPEGAFDPLRPLLIRPDVINDAAWQGGYEFGYLDNQKKFVYSYGWRLYSPLWINTDLAPESEIKSFKDLLAPKWKGKIISTDPRTGGAAASPLSIARGKYGSEIIKQFYVDQEAVISRDPRQVAEFLARGRYAIAFGATPELYEDLQKEGLGKGLKRVFLEDITSVGGETVWVMNRAPHPNAAKLYVNWLLTQQAQRAYAKEIENSRRKDVPIRSQETYPPPGAETRYGVTDRENKIPLSEEVRVIARDLLK